MSVLEIVQAGHPVLRQVARPLERDEILVADIQQLIADMRDTMRAAPGVGLAAPQVGIGLQLAVIEDPATVSEEDLRKRDRERVPFHVIINPRLVVEEAEPATFYEGCLSVEGYAARVGRARVVRVDALDEKAQPVTIRAHGWYARILQHEIDHLNGILYIDRMDTRTFAAADNLIKYPTQ